MVSIHFLVSHSFPFELVYAEDNAGSCLKVDIARRTRNEHLCANFAVLPKDLLTITLISCELVCAEDNAGTFLKVDITRRTRNEHLCALFAVLPKDLLTITLISFELVCAEDNAGTNY